MAVVNNGGYSLYYAAAGDVQTGRLVVSGFTWTGMTTSSHTLTFKNGAGTAIVMGPFTTNATLNPVTVMFSKPMYFDGLEVDVLGSGVVTVFLA